MTEVLRRKVNEDEKEILDILVGRYESQEERCKRIVRFLEYVDYWHTRYNVDYGKKELRSLLRRVRDEELSAVLFDDLKPIFTLKRNDVEILRTIAILLGHDLYSIDILFGKKKLLVRMIPPGGNTSRIYLIRREDEAWIMRVPSEGNTINDKAWKRFLSCMGGQKVKRKSRNIVIEEYCGIDLNQLYTVAIGGETNFLAGLLDGLSLKVRRLSNVTYKPDSEELVVIDRD